MRFNPGDASTGKEPVVNLHLHGIRENTQMRDERILVMRDDRGRAVAKRRAEIRLNLSYLVSVHAPDDAGAEHRLLSEVMKILFKNPVLPEVLIPEELLVDSGQVLVTVAQPDHDVSDETALIVKSMGGRLRPTLSIVVTAAFNPFESREVKLVRYALMRMHQSNNPLDPGPVISEREVSVSLAGMVVAEVVGGRSTDGLPGITVEIPELGVSALTDHRGVFHFTNLLPRKYELQIQRRGFKDQKFEATAVAKGRGSELEPVVVYLERSTESAPEKTAAAAGKKK
mgnify:CR=1 FL=1